MVTTYVALHRKKPRQLERGIRHWMLLNTYVFVWLLMSGEYYQMIQRLCRLGQYTFRGTYTTTPATRQVEIAPPAAGLLPVAENFSPLGQSIEISFDRCVCALSLPLDRCSIGGWIHDGWYNTYGKLLNRATLIRDEGGPASEKGRERERESSFSFEDRP